MFDLEKAILEWRQQMLAVGIKAPVPLDELESHLREDVKQQAHGGVAAQQAFEVAVQRIGTPRVLGAEFAEADRLNCSRTGSFRPFVLVINFFLAVIFAGPKALAQLQVFIALQLIYEVSIWIMRQFENKAKIRLEI